MKRKQVQRKNQEAVTKLIDLQRAVEKVQLLEVWSWECASNSQFFCYECCADTLRITERVVVEGSAAAPLQTYTAILPGSKFNVALLRLVMQEATRALFKVRPEVRIKIYVDDKKVAHANKNGRRSN